jgi:Cu/Ag efflux pump CusA
VTLPIAQALAGLLGRDRARPESSNGFSIVTAVIVQQAELPRVRQFVAERLATVGARLPAAVSSSIVIPPTSSSATVPTIGVQTDGVLLRLRDVIDTVRVPNLLAGPGVADVTACGGDARVLQVELRPADLARLGVGLDELAAALDGVFEPSAALSASDNTNQHLPLQWQSQGLVSDALAATTVADRRPVGRAGGSGGHRLRTSRGSRRRAARRQACSRDDEHRAIQRQYAHGSESSRRGARRLRAHLAGAQDHAAPGPVRLGQRFRSVR